VLLTTLSIIFFFMFLTMFLTFLFLLFYECNKRSLYVDLVQFEYSVLFKFMMSFGKSVQIFPVHEKIAIFYCVRIFFIYKFSYKLKIEDQQTKRVVFTSGIKGKEILGDSTNKQYLNSSKLTIVNEDRDFENIQPKVNRRLEFEKANGKVF
jgi:hypothetical protein